jgi:hypothetical protein
VGYKDWPPTSSPRSAGTSFPSIVEDPNLAVPTPALAVGKRARRLGVPTLKIDDDKVVYGPIITVGPSGDEGLELWDEVRRLSARPAFFELKRWPRDLRPGGRPVGPYTE